MIIVLLFNIFNFMVKITLYMCICLPWTLPTSNGWEGLFREPTPWLAVASSAKIVNIGCPRIMLSKYGPSGKCNSENYKNYPLITTLSSL
jgi:hypothetical protein